MRIPASASPDVQGAFRELWTAFNPLLMRNVDFTGRRITNAGDAIEPRDYVTKIQLDTVGDALHERLKDLEDEKRPKGKLELINAVRIAPFAQRGAPLRYAGTLFVASDRNYVTWASDGSAWYYICGVQKGTLSPDQKPTLTSVDEGYRFYSTDFEREYRWSGSAWADSPGQPPRSIQFFDVAPTGNGWQICNGSIVTTSTATAGTASITVPNYATASYLKAATSAAVGPSAASGTTANEASHTHGAGTYATDAVSAGTPSGTVSQPTFTGSALGTHQHELPIQNVSGTVFRHTGTPFGTGTSRAAVGSIVAVADTTSAAVAMSEAVSAGTPSGTVSQPTFTGSAMGTHSHAVTGTSGAGSAHNHGPGTVELQRTQLLAYYRL